MTAPAINVMIAAVPFKDKSDSHQFINQIPLFHFIAPRIYYYTQNAIAFQKIMAGINNYPTVHKMFFSADTKLTPTQNAGVQC